jgi:hypothetical protein
MIDYTKVLFTYKSRAFFPIQAIITSTPCSLNDWTSPSGALVSVTTVDTAEMGASRTGPEQRNLVWSAKMISWGMVAIKKRSV